MKILRSKTHKSYAATEHNSYFKSVRFSWLLTHYYVYNFSGLTFFFALRFTNTNIYTNPNISSMLPCFHTAGSSKHSHDDGTSLHGLFQPTYLHCPFPGHEEGPVLNVPWYTDDVSQYIILKFLNYFDTTLFGRNLVTGFRNPYRFHYLLM